MAETGGVPPYSTPSGLGLRRPIFSLAHQIAGRALIFFSRYAICDEKSVIIIDEPEMNAHPEAQLKLIELLAILANSGVKVIITTHSPYIVDHLNNLMTAARLPEEAKAKMATEFKLKDKKAFISSNDVSSYLFSESGEVQDIKNEEKGLIKLGTFWGYDRYMINLCHRTSLCTCACRPGCIGGVEACS